jgi:hypothetical protein
LIVGVSIPTLHIPLNPALLKHAEMRRQHAENRTADAITRLAK